MAIRDEAAVLHAFVAAVDDATIDRVAARMVDAMAAAVREVDADPDVRADALAASRQTAAGFVYGLSADPWIAPSRTPALDDLARTLARRGEDITTLIKLTRFGQSEYWPALMEVAERSVEDPGARMRLLNTLYERFGRYLEALLDGALVIFQEERDTLIRGVNARREETIRALLDGAEINVDAASRTLGYELRGRHTAFELWDETGGHDALDRLEVLARQLAGAFGAARALTTPSGARGLWAWVTADRDHGDEQRALVAACRIPDGTHVAVGRSATGPAGFRQSHEEALAARRAAREHQVTWYADVEIASLLSRDGRAARALVARELAGLAGADAQSEKLRSTVLAYIRCGCSATAAARELGVHTNTVRYRVTQAEELVGRRLEGQELPLFLALILVDTLGPGWLPG